MGFHSVQCPSCGSNVELDSSREFGICSFCGANVAIDKVIVEHRGSINVNGIVNVNSVLERAKMFLEDKKYDAANVYSERVLDIDPKNADAYIVKLMAKTHKSQREYLGRNNKPLEKYDCYRKAVRFASPEVRKELSEYNESTKKNFNDEKERKLANLKYREAELDEMRSDISDREREFYKNYFWVERHDLLKYITIGINILLLFLLGFSWRLFYTLAIECALVLLILWFINKRLSDKESSLCAESNRIYHLKEDFENTAKKAYKEWLSEMEKNC